MVNISNKDWTDFVVEVRSRLDVIDAHMDSIKQANEFQHKRLGNDFSELKEYIMGTHDGSIANRVRSLENSRARMNGLQLGLSAAFSIITATIAWMMGNPSVRLGWNDAVTKLASFVEGVGNFFKRG